MDVLERLEKAKQSVERAINEYERGDKRLSLGNSEDSLDNLIAIKYLLVAEIKDNHD